MNQDISYFEALDALAWQIELGADEAIGEKPVNRFEVEKTKAIAQTPEAEARPAPTPVSADAGALELAAECASLDALKTAIVAFEGCALKKGARNTVFADGNPDARVMIIGEAPGREEDQAGKPFVGRSGQLLDRMLSAIGLRRDADAAHAVYITNVMPWRPPQNRDPSTDEMLMMRAFLVRHIALAAPEFIVTMGNPATKTVLEVTTGITRMRGNWSEFQSIPVLPMFHPAALLRDPLKKREAWADLLSLKARLGDG